MVRVKGKITLKMDKNAVWINTSKNKSKIMNIMVRKGKCSFISFTQFMQRPNKINGVLKYTRNINVG